MNTDAVLIEIINIMVESLLEMLKMDLKDPKRIEIQKLIEDFVKLKVDISKGKKKDELDYDMPNHLNN